MKIIFKKISKFHRCIILLLSAIFFLSGCATVEHIPVKPTIAQNLKTVYVNPNIKKPDKMYEFVSGEEYGFAIAGIVGALVAADMADKTRKSTQDYIEKNHIDVKKIVYDQFMAQLRNNSNVTIVSHLEKADAVFAIDIPKYGISIPHGFSRQYAPMLFVDARLVQKNQIIWQDSERVLPISSGMPRYTSKQIMSDPHTVYAMWNTAAEKVVRKLLIDSHFYDLHKHAV